MTINKTKSERGFIYRVVLISVVLLAVFSVVALRVASDMDNVRSIYAVRIAGAGRFSRAMETARRIEDREILSTLGNSLGRYDLESQLAELDFALDQLDTAIARHSTSLPERKRLGMGLAWAGGALLVIALL